VVVFALYWVYAMFPWRQKKAVPASVD
jgi:hypothetical protein